MCDTIVATPEATRTGATLFGKNSDRQRNEAHVVRRLAGGDHEPGASVACTYIQVPQARRTQDVLFCGPFWTWGPEMGVNASGVAIGNEAVHARAPASETPSLIGMDLAGLALQRAGTAAEAVEIIAALLKAFGQGGDCGHLAPSYYNNSYIIADPTEAWVLETVGREWAAERVRGVRAISNTYSVEQPTRISDGLHDLISQCAGPGEGYASRITDPGRQHLGNAVARQARATELLERAQAQVDMAAMTRVLRDHGHDLGDAGAWRPDTATERTICMHATDHGQGGQTSGALVSELRATGAVHWVTAASSPCLTVFRPAFVDLPLPAHGPKPTDRADAESLWWRHERLHRAALCGDFAAILQGLAPERDKLEASFQRRIADVIDAPAERRFTVVKQCWREADEAEARWLAGAPLEPRSEPSAADEAWAKFNRLAGFSLGGVW